MVQNFIISGQAQIALFQGKVTIDLVTKVIAKWLLDPPNWGKIGVLHRADAYPPVYYLVNTLSLYIRCNRAENVCPPGTASRDQTEHIRPLSQLEV